VAGGLTGKKRNIRGFLFLAAGFVNTQQTAGEFEKKNEFIVSEVNKC